MTPERWQRIEALLHSALARAPEERSAFLLRECAEDDPLRSEVESLIAHHAEAACLLEMPLPEIAAELLAEEHAPLAAGRVIGHYQVIAPLGAGGMGEVYLAMDTRLGRRIALKILPAWSNRDQSRSHRFEQEARAASALNHPNIMTVYEIGNWDSIHFMAAEFVDGHTVRQVMAARNMTVIDALDVAIQTAAALAAAHDAGIVHRDIKPENIMLRQDGLIKVLDFGLAKPIKHNTQPDSATSAGHCSRTDRRMILGTPHYMSPEQARGQDLDARTDIFSLGIVLFEMIAGRSPFQGNTPSDVIASILLCEPQPLSRLAPDIPGEMVRVVSKALAKDKQERYQSMDELLSDLRNLKQEVENKKNNSRGLIGLESGKVQIRRFGRAAAVSLLSLVLWIASFGYSKNEGKTIMAATARRIAVLPVENLSGDPQQEYFADGLTDDLITVLGRIKALNVISRTSVMGYKGTRKPLPEIARQINANYLIEASTVRVGNRVRINVRLFDAATEQPRWSESYQRDIEDILALQDDLARGIAREISVKLSPEEEAQFNRKETVNPEAYDACKMGDFHFNRRTADGFRTSIKYYEQAIARDPACALAYAGLAFSYTFRIYSGDADMPQEEAVSKARSAAERALELDPMQAEAHAALGLIYWKHDYAWGRAGKELRRAVELNPNYSEGRLWYAKYLNVMGRKNESREEFKTAYLMDPMSPNIVANYAGSLAGVGNFEQALRMQRRAVELSRPGQINTYLGLAHIYERMGRYPEAIAELQKALKISGGAFGAKAILAGTYAHLGRRAEAEKILSDLCKKGCDDFTLASFSMTLGRKEEAIHFLEKMYQGKRTGLWLLKVQGIWDPLRSDPRFQDLLRRLGLPPDNIKIKR